MRIPVLATLLSLSLVGCAGEISGGGGDDDIPATCGNGSLDTGETCDDGNNADGDGCSAACTTEIQPRLDLSVDKPTLATELGTTNMVTVTFTSTGGFTGQVPVTATIVDGAGTAIADWVIAVNPPTVTVPANGTVNAVVTFGVPSLKSSLAGTLKISTTASGTEGGTLNIDTPITVADQFTIPMKLNGGQCEYPPAGTIELKVGTTLRWFNNEQAGSGNLITIHVNNGNAAGVPHQPDPGSDPQTAYERTLVAAATNISWYCHAPGPTVNGLVINVLP